MTSPLVRLGDINQAGGAVVSSVASTVLTNGLPTSLIGGSVSAHPPCSPESPAHCSAVVTQASGTVFAEGQPVVYVGAVDSCGHSRATGSPNVLVST